jgi:hypothetical protein
VEYYFCKRKKSKNAREKSAASCRFLGMGRWMIFICLLLLLLNRQATARNAWTRCVWPVHPSIPPTTHRTSWLGHHAILSPRDEPNPRENLANELCAGPDSRVEFSHTSSFFFCDALCCFFLHPVVVKKTTNVQLRKWQDPHVHSAACDELPLAALVGPSAGPADQNPKKIKEHVVAKIHGVMLI